MPKRTLFTNITPLPPQVTREVAVAMLHNHDEMIELNPLVIEHHPIRTPRDAPADEFLDCVWQELTDKIHYLPGGIAKGKVSYKACFHDLPTGLQTHIYAPLGLDIREKWSVGGTLPGEPPEPRELGLDVPRQGLYLREDGDMRCNIILTGFVRKNLDHAHKVLVERILKKAERIEEHRETMSHFSYQPASPGPMSPGFQAGSHMANSQLVNTPILGRAASMPQIFQQASDRNSAAIMNHPALRNNPLPGSDQDARVSTYTLPPYQNQNQRTSYYSADMVKQEVMGPKQLVAELPGSTYHSGTSTPQGSNSDSRNSVATYSGSEGNGNSSELNPSSDRLSKPSEMQGGYRHVSHEQYVQLRPSNSASSSRYSESAASTNRMPRWG